jgi:transcriptional regulator with XRE-family HTH domain
MGKHRNQFKEHPASKTLAKRLFRFRVMRNLTQAQFATLANLNDHSRVAYAESGASLRLDTLHKILRVLDGVA